MRIWPGMGEDFDPVDRAFIEADFDGRIRDILAGEEKSGRQFYVAGRPHVKSNVYRMMIDDLSRLIPAAVAVIALILFALTGSARMVLLPMGSVLVSTLWTFAGMSALDRPLTVLTTLLAPITTPLPMVTPLRIADPRPIHTSEPSEIDLALCACVLTSCLGSIP